MHRSPRSCFRSISPRDAIFVLLGAASMHLFSSFLPHLHESSFMNFNNIQVTAPGPAPAPTVLDSWHPPDPQPPACDPPSPIPNLGHEIPQTVLVSHAPGWTIFRNLYMADGTLFIVTSNPESFPSIDLMTSTGLPALNTPESIAERMPTARDMSVITPEEAHRRWGGQSMTELNNIFPVEGSTLLFNDPGQFLDHYYHFCAELLFGTWAFWHGTFRSAFSTTPTPPITRAIFPHATAEEWRDLPGMNSYFLRSAWPSLTVETEPDWLDRVNVTALRSDDSGLQGRAWWFDTVLLADRSAAFRGPECSERTQRTAAEAVKGVVSRESRTGFLERGWWEPVRRNVLRFAGVGDDVLDIGNRAFKHALHGSPRTGGVEEVVVTYISRQAVRRHLITEDHEGLVDALTELCERRGWELNIVAMEQISKEEQLAIAARTTFLVGVHGNGLTHLIMMPITPISTVIELFYPEGFVHDYEWTSRSLGMTHFAVWNNSAALYPDPKVRSPNYPEGFQGQQIPVHGPFVAKIIEDRADGLFHDISKETDLLF